MGMFSLNWRLGLLAVLLFTRQVTAAPIVIPGTVTGTWTNPQGGIIVVGGNQLNDGGSPVSMITFNGASVTTGNTPVSLGSLVAVNSANYGVENANANLSLQLRFNGGAVHTLVVPVSYHATLNVGTAVQQADTWTLGALPTLEFHEGGFLYVVQLLGFGNFTGSGFGDATHFTIYENRTATASLSANVTAVLNPEPASLLVWSLLLAGGYGVFRRGRRARQEL